MRLLPVKQMWENMRAKMRGQENFISKHLITNAN